MTLFEILQDIHAMEEDILMYERKYGILTEIFYESYMQGDEPPDDTWVMDWTGWAASYEIWLQRRKMYTESKQVYTDRKKHGYLSCYTNVPLGPRKKVHFLREQ